MTWKLHLGRDVHNIDHQLNTIHDPCHVSKIQCGAYSNVLHVVQGNPMFMLNMVYLNFRNVTLCNVTPSLVSWNPWGMDVGNSNLPPCCHISFMYIVGFDITLIHRKYFKPHTCMHRTVRIIIIVVIPMLTSVIPKCHMPRWFTINMHHVILYTSLLSQTLWLPHAWYKGG